MARVSNAKVGRDLNIKYAAYPTCREFHNSDAFIRVLVGAVGSGKSSATWLELFRRACNEWPDVNGVRSSHHLCVRDTYAMLKATTIKDFESWFGPVSEVVYDSPIRAKVNLELSDGTFLDWNLSFLSMDGGEKSLNALRGMQISGAYLNEGHSLPKDVWDVVISRTGRFRPAGRDPKWKGVISDSNFGYQGCYLHEMYQNPPPDVEFFEQPPAAYWDVRTNKFVLNPHCDNLDNLPGGLDYYQKILNNSSVEYIKQFLANQWAVRQSGKAIYPEYHPGYHLIRGVLQPDRRLPLLVGMDFGLHVAACIGQLSPQGRLIIFKEVWNDDADLETFLDKDLVPVLRGEYAGFKPIVCGDPAGMGRSSLDKRTAFKVLGSRGLTAYPSVSNDPERRWGAVKYFLTRQNGFGVHHSCKRIVEGFEGAYGFRKKADGSYSEDADKNVYSHCFAGGTLVDTARGFVRIEDVVVGDLVRTRSGYSVVSATMSHDAPRTVRLPNGSVCTPDHKYKTANRGLVRADALRYSDILYSIRRDTWEGRDLQANQDKSLTGASTPTTTGGGIIRARFPRGEQYPRSICTEKCGSSIMGSYGQDLKYTTSITTRQTTRLQTCTPCGTSAMTGCTLGRTIKAAQSGSGLKAVCGQKRYGVPQHGMDQMPVGSGIQNTESGFGMVGSIKPIRALIAGSSMRHAGRRSGTFAPLRARQQTEGSLESTTKSASAAFVEETSPLIGTAKRPCAAKRAQMRRVAVPGPRNVRVYDLTVEGDHEFFADGVLVSNCADSVQYLAMYARFGSKQNTDPLHMQRMERLNEIKKVQQLGRNSDDYFWA